MRLLRTLLLLALAATSAGAVRSAAALPDQTDVFISGQDGYHTYRIPAILRAANGDLLAFCEGRKSGGGDAGDIDLLMKRSTDGGRTWGPTQLIWDDEANTCGNPCPVLDVRSGTIHLLLTHNLGTDRERDIDAGTSKSTRTVWIAQSKDDGRTWSKPVNITSSTKRPEWRWYATGPGVGIQIQHGPHAGRLVIPCDHSYVEAEGAPIGRGSHAIFSDDGGKTWKLSDVIRPKMNECQVAELFDGRGTLLMNMRSYHGRSRRAHSISRDGGATWTPTEDAEQLVEPVCQASIIRMDTAKRGDRGLILFSNPADPKQRINLTVRASADDGRTWRNLVVLQPGPAAYSCLVSLSPTEAGCLYERGEKRAYEKITFARFGVK